MSLQGWLTNFINSVARVAQKFEAPNEVRRNGASRPESDRHAPTTNWREPESRPMVGLMTKLQIYSAFEQALRSRFEGRVFEKDAWHEVLGEEVYRFLEAFIARNPNQASFKTLYMEHIWEALEERTFLERRFVQEEGEEDEEEGEEGEEYEEEEELSGPLRGPPLSEQGWIDEEIA